MAAFLTFVACSWGSWVAWHAGGWWLVLLPVLFLVAAACAYGAGESLQKRRRP